MGEKVGSFSKNFQLLLLHNNRPPTTSEYSRDPQSAGWPFSATIQSRSSVSGVAFLGHYPVEIFSRRDGLSRPLSSRDLQSAGRPFSATIQSRSSVSGVAFLGHSTVKIFSQRGGLSWPLSSRDLQSPRRPFLATIQSRSSVTGEAFLGHYPVEIFSQQGGLLGHSTVEIFSQRRGLSRPLSSRDLQSAGRPFSATIQSRSSAWSLLS